MMSNFSSCIPRIGAAEACTGAYDPEIQRSVVYLDLVSRFFGLFLITEKIPTSLKLTTQTQSPSSRPICAKPATSCRTKARDPLADKFREESLASM